MIKFDIVVDSEKIIVFKNNVRYMTYFRKHYKIEEIADFYGVEFSEILFF